MKIVLWYIVVNTASTTRWRPYAKKSRTTTSLGLEASTARIPLGFVTKAMSGSTTSFRMDTKTPTRPECIVCCILPLGHRTTCLSRDSTLYVESPHCGQRDPSNRRSLPRQGALLILGMVSRAVVDQTALREGMSDYKIETMSWPEWFKSFGREKGDTSL